MIKITQELYNVFADNLCSYIIPNNQKYKNQGFQVFIHENKLLVRYNEHEYNIELVKENNIIYWKLVPYQDSYFTTQFYKNSFDIVLSAIVANEKAINKGFLSL